MMYIDPCAPVDPVVLEPQYSPFDVFLYMVAGCSGLLFVVATGILMFWLGQKVGIISPDSPDD